MLTCRIKYTPIGTAPNHSTVNTNTQCTKVLPERSNIHPAHKKAIKAGNPSVFLCLQLYQICGMSCTHQNTVPMVPRAVDAVVTFPSLAMVTGTPRKRC